MQAFSTASHSDGLGFCRSKSFWYITGNIEGAINHLRMRSSEESNIENVANVTRGSATELLS
jgi:hypothetical protein